MRLTAASAWPEELTAAGFCQLAVKQADSEKETGTSCRLGYRPAEQQPLCADVGLVLYEGGWILYDVGTGEAAATAVQQALQLPGQGNIVLSHFHPDHCGGLGQLALQDSVRLWQSGFTAKHTLPAIEQTVQSAGNITEDIRVLPIPSGHAKGCLALQAEEFLFVGDALYPGTGRRGEGYYNVSALAQQLQILQQSGAQYCLLSHEKKYCYPMRGVLNWLQKVYARRKPGEAYLFL